MTGLADWFNPRSALQSESVPGRYLLMMLAVSAALVMEEWMRTSYFSPSIANLCPVYSACSRPAVKTEISM